MIVMEMAEENGNGWLRSMRVLEKELSTRDRPCARIENNLVAPDPHLYAGRIPPDALHSSPGDRIAAAHSPEAHNKLIISFDRGSRLRQ